VGFEFDPEKSTKNKGKHGIDFEQAQALWDDARAIEIPSNHKQEERRARIARLEIRSGQRFSLTAKAISGSFRCVEHASAKKSFTKFYETDIS